MTTWQDPGDPDPQTPPADEDRDKDRSPFERPPFDKDPEAQHAPGENEQDPTSDTPPPMQANQQAGNDNIREGRVGGVMGAPAATNGQGQGD
jgi:hypothetical protein